MALEMPVDGHDCCPPEIELQQKDCCVPDEASANTRDGDVADADLADFVPSTVLPLQDISTVLRRVHPPPDPIVAGPSLQVLHCVYLK